MRKRKKEERKEGRKDGEREEMMRSKQTFIEDLLYVSHCAEDFPNVISFDLHNNLTMGGRCYYYPHFILEETEADRGKVIYPGSHKW